MKVTIYSAPGRVDCEAAKRFFWENGAEFEDKNIADPKFRDELVQRCGRMATPTIIIDYEIILGFGINKDKIAEKLNLERR